MHFLKNNVYILYTTLRYYCTFFLCVRILFLGFVGCYIDLIKKFAVVMKNLKKKLKKWITNIVPNSFTLVLLRSSTTSSYYYFIMVVLYYLVPPVHALVLVIHYYEYIFFSQILLTYKKR